MTSAYSTFANEGTFIEPTYITRIEDKDGRIIYTTSPKIKEVISEKYNHAVVRLLQHASQNHLSKLSSPWGGKTGTTNDFVDGWFMGISPDLVVGTWVGGENNWIRFTRIGDGSGGKMARPFYLDFMKRLEDDPEIKLNQGKDFSVPLDVVDMDCASINKRLPSKEEKDRAVKIKILNDEAFEEEFN